MSALEGVLMGLIVLLGGWFVVGALNNNSRARRFFDWLDKGLGPYGKLSGIKRLGANAIAVELKSDDAENPFPHCEVVLDLERRESLPLYIYGLVQHKRDRLTINTNLLRTPHSEIHALMEADKASLAALDNKEHPLTLRSTHGGLQIYSRDSVDHALMQALDHLLDRYPDCFTSLSLKTKTPNLETNIALGNATGQEADQFFAELAKLAQG